MDEIRLIKPTMEYAEEVMAFRRALLDTNADFAGCGSLKYCLTAEEWFEKLKKFEKAETCPEGAVPSDSYIAVRQADSKIIGAIDLRHHIDHPILGTWGGHMGYVVRPDERGKGYAKEMLRRNLINAKALGLKKVMITCSHDNIASEKTILGNGGVFEGTIDANGETYKRHWISLED